ncbi:MAG: hypothetical protein ACJ8FY_19170 [Gemmataceae bacterium]
MHRVIPAVTILMTFALASGRTEETKALGPVEARKEIGKTKVRSAKDRLEKHNEIYLDAEENFKDPMNFAVVITKKGAAKFKEAGIASVAEHFRDKVIRAKGLVKEVQKVPRIEIDDPAQLQVVDKK